MNTAIRICRFSLRCLRRTLVTLLIVIAISAACLWVRSYWVADRIEHHLYRVTMGGSPVQIRQALATIASHDDDDDDGRNWFPGGSFWWADVSIFTSRGGVMLGCEIESKEFGRGHALETAFEDTLDDLLDPYGAELPLRHRREPAVKYPALWGKPPRWFPGFGWESSPSSSDREFRLVFPYWSVLIIALPYPFWRARHVWVLHRKRRLGLCLRCGYDLRASVDRCPECGLAFTRGVGPGAIGSRCGSEA